MTNRLILAIRCLSIGRTFNDAVPQQTSSLFSREEILDTIEPFGENTYRDYQRSDRTLAQDVPEADVSVGAVDIEEVLTT